MRRRCSRQREIRRSVLVRLRSGRQMCVDELINFALGIFSARFGHEDILETTGGQASLFGDVTGMMVINVDPGRRISRASPMAKGGAEPS
jgi:hypothetical protein